MNTEKLIGTGDLVSIGHQPKLYVVLNVKDGKCSLIGLEMSERHDREKMVGCEEELKFLTVHSRSEIEENSCLAAIQESVLADVDMTPYIEA